MRTFEDVTVEAFKRDPEEAQIFLSIVLRDYGEDGDIKPLMSAIELVAEAQGGVDKLARRLKMSKSDLEARLKSRAKINYFELATILRGIGYRVSVEPLQVA